MGKEISLTANVVGYCRPIVDRTFVLNEADAISVLTQHGLAMGVTFVDDEVIGAVVATVESQIGASKLISPGGPVSNALYSFADSLGSYPRTLAPTWTGPTPAGAANDPDDPLPSLRAVGIRTVTQTSARLDLPQSLCLVGREDGDTKAILVGHREVMPDPSGLPDAHLALTMISDLPDLVDVSAIRSFALMSADIAIFSPELHDAINAASSSGQIRYLFGTLSELTQLGVVGASVVIDRRFAETEVIATNGAQPVSVWLPGATEPIVLPLETVIESDGTFLGAGDAYTGSYLAARLEGREALESHIRAAGSARRASYHHRARSASTTNLTELFGSFIDRASDQPDWALFETLRHSAGTTIVSCGNTGVDEIAGRVAARWGLPFFAVMPRSGRRDDESTPPTSWDVLELGTPSFRYCTWTNVYLADGTILIDLAGTEGSAETRRAAEILNRPILELDTNGTARETFLMARNWARAHGVRVTNIAGNRERSFASDTSAKITEHVDAAVRGIAAQFQHSIPFPAPLWALTRPSLIGIPRLAEVSEAVLNVLRAHDQIADLDPSRLTWVIGRTTLLRAKSRDLVKAVARGDLSAALVGLDMVLDEPLAEVQVVAQSGLFNSMIAVVGPESPRIEGGMIGAQYPAIAARDSSYEMRDIVSLAGAGEGWVTAGVIDELVDTWRTGKTARQHGLSWRREIARCPLVLIAPLGKDVPTLALSLIAEIAEPRI